MRNGGSGEKKGDKEDEWGESSLRILWGKGSKGVYRLHTAILNRPLSNAATKEV